MEEGKYIRGLSDGELSRMLNLDRDRYTKPEIAVAEAEMDRRKRAGASEGRGEPAAPVEAQPGGTSFYADMSATREQDISAFDEMDWRGRATPAGPEAAGTGDEEPPPPDVEELIRSLSGESLSDMVNVHAGRYSKAQLDIAFDEIGRRERAGEGAVPEPEYTLSEAAGWDAGDADDEEVFEDEGEEENEREPADGTVRCAWCGREMPGDAKFCMECGKKVGAFGGEKLNKQQIGIIVAAVFLIVFLLIKCS